MKNKHVILTLFCFAAFTMNANCQIAILNLAEVPKIKSGTTYIAMKDPESEKAKAFIDMFKSTWTISKF